MTYTVHYDDTIGKWVREEVDAVGEKVLIYSHCKENAEQMEAHDKQTCPKCCTTCI